MGSLGKSIKKFKENFSKFFFKKKFLVGSNSHPKFFPLKENSISHYLPKKDIPLCIKSPSELIKLISYHERRLRKF